jgi:hypothetical protein
VPPVRETVHDQAFGSRSNHVLKAAGPRRLQPEQHGNRLQQRRFANGVSTHDAGNLRMEFSFQPGKTSEITKRQPLQRHATDLSLRSG